jgi:hypothetical protein
MKKVLKSFTALALGLSFVLGGCSSDDDDDFNVAGTYPVRITIAELGRNFDTDLVVTKNGHDLKATAVVDLSTLLMGNMTISLDLTSTEHVKKDKNNEVYLFKIPQQDIRIEALQTSIPFKGQGEFEEHDGVIGKMEGKSHVAFSIKSVNEIPGIGTYLTIHVATQGIF